MPPTVLTFSALKTFNNCPVMYDLRYEDCLRPAEDIAGDARAIGTSFHGALGVMLLKGLTEALRATPAVDVRAVKARVMLRILHGLRDFMLPGRATAIEGNIGPVAIPGIRGFKVAGRIDAFEDGWVWEYKTVDRLDNQLPLQYDMQGLLYVWILRQMGIACKGLQVISIVRSGLKGKKTESYEDLEQRMYDIAMEHPLDWVHAEPHEPAPSEITWIEEKIRSVIAEIRWARSKHGVFRENMPGGCFPYSRKCDYRPICWALEQERDGVKDAMFIESAVHPELEKEQTKSF